METNQKIRAYRKRAGLTQYQLCEKCGMHHSEISVYERGVRNPTLQTIARIAKGLGVHPSELLPDWIKRDGDGEPTVDAVPVVHGRWECTYDEATGETDVTCSRCKSTRTINGCYVTTKGESCYFEDNYCPNCGADMRERSEGE